MAWDQAVTKAWEWVERSQLLRLLMFFIIKNCPIEWIEKEPILVFLRKGLSPTHTVHVTHDRYM